MISVHVVDDHKVVVQGLSGLIKESGIATVTGVSHTLADCRNALAFETPDVLLLDLNLPDGNGIDFCTEIRQKYPNIKVLVLTSHDEYSVAKRVMDNGASGYILKNALSEEMVAGIDAVMNNKIFLCDEINILMKKQKDELIWLTTREHEVLTLVAEGCSTLEVAEKLFLSEETIKTYRKNVIAKLHAKNTIDAINIARKMSLI